MPPEAPLQNAEALEGKVAFFGQSKRGSVPMFYDCAWRAKKAGAIGVVFVTEGNAERMASEEYHAPVPFPYDVAIPLRRHVRS